MNKVSSFWLAQESFNYYFFHFSGVFFGGRGHTYKSKVAFSFVFHLLYFIFFLISFLYFFGEGGIKLPIWLMKFSIVSAMLIHASYGNQNVGFPFSFCIFQNTPFLFLSFISTYTSFMAHNNERIITEAFCVRQGAKYFTDIILFTSYKLWGRYYSHVTHEEIETLNDKVIFPGPHSQSGVEPGLKTRPPASTPMLLPTLPEGFLGLSDLYLE